LTIQLDIPLKSLIFQASKASSKLLTPASTYGTRKPSLGQRDFKDRGNKSAGAMIQQVQHELQQSQTRILDDFG